MCFWWHIWCFSGWTPTLTSAAASIPVCLRSWQGMALGCNYFFSLCRLTNYHGVLLQANSELGKFHHDSLRFGPPESESLWFPSHRDQKKIKFVLDGSLWFIGKLFLSRSTLQIVLRLVAFALEMSEIAETVSKYDFMGNYFRTHHRNILATPYHISLQIGV